MEDEIGAVKQPRLERHIFQAACIEWECHNSLPSLDDHELQPNLVLRGAYDFEGGGHDLHRPDERPLSTAANFPRSAKERAGHAQNGSETRIISPLSAPGGSEEGESGPVLWHVPYPPSHFPLRLTSLNGINCLRECPPPVSTPWSHPCGERRRESVGKARRGSVVPTSRRSLSRVKNDVLPKKKRPLSPSHRALYSLTLSPSRARVEEREEMKAAHAKLGYL